MSIAVSAVVKTSRSLLLLVDGGCIGVAVIGVVIGAGMVGDLSFFLQSAVATVCISFAFCAVIYLNLCRKTHRIDISGNGQIRLTETTAWVAWAYRQCSVKKPLEGVQVKLLPDSTLWPFLLLLNLKTSTGRVIRLVILMDSIDRESFRALSVACRWIATHREPTQQGIFSDFGSDD